MGIKQKQQHDTAPVLSSGGRIANLKAYFGASRTELGKISWPTRKEVKATAFAVAILVVIMSFFLGIVDLFLSWVIESVLSIGL